jgi:very-short-patch-repair endonuclease
MVYSASAMSEEVNTHNQPNQQPRPVIPPISADFLTGSAETGLERIRTRLLDLTNRNKLLNFRHSPASSLRVVDVHLDTVFMRIREGEKLFFLPVPEPDDDEEESEKQDAAAYAQQLGWRASFDLDDVPEPEEYDGSLPVLHYQERLDTLSRKIASSARTAIEESGTNMLYLVFGFLEWYESDDSRQPRYAPLVILPVTIDRPIGERKAFQCELEYSGEDLETNLSLIEKMRRDMGLEIPALEDDDSPELYFARFEPLLNVKKRWRLRREITLSLLSFGKLLMFRDLDPKNWPAAASISKHSLVRELFEGTKSLDITHAEEFAIDDPELKRELPPLIVDADSSQHSALIHALRGQNLVIEGPPGTGKSQTITNLIAAALAKGKTVLFISEKLAALEVVRRRLDDCGLGMFCLELHSHKTKKGALLNDLAQRLRLVGSFRDPPELDRHILIAEEKKRLLTEYVSLINRIVEPIQSTVFDILWARDRAYQELPFEKNLVAHLLLPAVLQYSGTQVTQAEQFLAVYTQHLLIVLSVCEQIDQHPWGWVRKQLSFEGEEACAALLAEFVEKLQTARRFSEILYDTAGIVLEPGVPGLERSAQILSTLPVAQVGYMAHLLMPCRDASVRRLLVAFVTNLETFQTFSQHILQATSHADYFLEKNATDRLSQVIEHLCHLGLDSCSVSQLREAHHKGVAAESALNQAQASFHALLSFLGCKAPFTLETSRFLVEVCRTMETAPMEVLHLRSPALEADGAIAHLRSARDEARFLKSLHSRLATQFDLASGSGVQFAAELAHHATVIERTPLLERWFGRTYKTAVKAYKRLALNHKKAARSDMTQALTDVATYWLKRSNFDSNETHRARLGAHFVGMESNWDDLVRLAGWYEHVIISFPEHQPDAESFRILLLKARSERIRGIKLKLPTVAEHRSVLEQLLANVSELTRLFSKLEPVTASGRISEMLAAVNQINMEIMDALEEIERAGVAADISIQQMPSLIAAGAECSRALLEIQEATEIPQLVGKAYTGVHTDTAPIKATVQFAESVTAHNLPQKAEEWLLNPEYETRLGQLRSWLETVQTLGHQLAQIGENLAELSDCQIWKNNTPESMAGLEVLAMRALDCQEDLPRWLHFVRLQAQSEEAGLGKLTKLADERVFEPQHLSAAFNLVFYSTLARNVFSQHPLLSQVTGVTQEQIRDQFAKADKEIIRLDRKRAAAQIDRRSVPGGNQTGPVGTWSELALLRHEINKQKRHIPIRQLTRRASRALQALKPCFMMGPLSVAQYLEPGQLKFDLIVMDEASQLKPEDAIGAMARGQQIVIVGDPKQLPPTTFFQRIALPADGDDEDSQTAVEEGESILDVASTLYQPVRRLRWHYRSRHHSLIAFSNREFYQDDLVIFPSAYHEDPSLGVKYRAVPNGVCENSRNPLEAAVVVDAVLDHMRDCANESLGVVALNFEQRELIEELLDHRLRDDPFGQSYQERMKGPESFFIKNLENVQGDERDVIFISSTYGPDSLGNQFQRFGPINGENGHRRLNVLFTRAKKRTVVFSSLDPDKIQTTPNSPWGLRVLKQYLNFARSGILEGPDHGLDQPTNDFEMSVGAVLKEKGLDVVPQVGVAGFFIDLGIRHPLKPGTFLLGIECDGASYHSGRSARDRDRLRQEILVNLGWKIHRIWSTDWFKSRDNEIKRLLRHVEDLLASDPLYRKQAERAE